MSGFLTLSDLKKNVMMSVNQKVQTLLDSDVSRRSVVSTSSLNATSFGVHHY